jgi:CBS domain-containing protein
MLFMKTQMIKNLMVPLSEYATVPVDATLLDAVVALEKAQAAFDQTKYRHRAVLVLDKDNQVVGKIGQLDALKALEPKYQDIQDPVTPGAYRHFSKSLLKSILEQHRLFDQPLKDLRRKTASLKVRDFMYTPTEGEYLSENATLDEAIHMLVMGHHHSLLVTRGRRIVGILRLTDLFATVFHSLKQDALDE